MSDSPENETADERSKQRTKWAEDRTVLANERTFNSWMGTGLGAIGVAIGLKAVFGEFEPTWAAKGVATIFLGTAILIFWAARQQAHSTHERLNSHDSKTQPTRNYTRLAVVLSFAAFATGVILWLL